MTSLTSEQERVLCLRAHGWSVRETARMLGKSPETVKYQCAEIYRKLGADSLLDALWIVGWLYIGGCEPSTKPTHTLQG